MDYLRTLLITLTVATIIFISAFVIQMILIDKDNVIIKQTDTNIFVKIYKPTATVNKSFKFFNASLDSTIYKYPQNKILYDGVLIKAEHSPDLASPLEDTLGAKGDTSKRRSLCQGNAGA
jgi:hypothetical protein